MSINDISNKLAEHIVSGLQEEDINKQQVIAYGIFAIIHTLICILMVMVVGAIFGVFIEATIISFAIAILRKSTGGAHMGTPELCAILGTVVAVGLALVSNNINLEIVQGLGIGVLVFAFSYYWIYQLAPVESEAKPIRRAEKRKLLKKQSILTISIYLLIVGVLIGLTYMKNDMRILDYIMCIYLAVLWQTLTLTKSGHYILGKIDRSLRYHFVERR